MHLLQVEVRMLLKFFQNVFESVKHLEDETGMNLESSSTLVRRVRAGGYRTDKGIKQVR
jgi:hypothetical protein